MPLRRTALLVATALLACLALILPAGTASATVSFSDVPSSNQFAADIDWLVARGITVGYPDGTYRPAGPVTRQAMALFLYRYTHPGAADPACDPHQAPPFPDVPVTATACGAISWLVGQGITVGAPDGTYRPFASVTRQAMALFLYRLGHGSTPAPACASKPFPDVATSAIACGAIAWLVGQGITTGYPNGDYGPILAVSRGAMAAFLHRDHDVQNSSADISYPQCGKTWPTGQLSGVVGVNNGKPTTFNPCLAGELAWAQGSTGQTAQPLVQLYVNTANPGAVTPRVASWPTSGNSTRYGTCSGGDDTACAYLYGRARAAEDVAKVTRPQDHVWWLDVELGNTWDLSGPNGRSRNAAVLEGMTDYLRSQGVAGVGLYSTGYQWGSIVGSGVSTTSSLLGLPSWIAGTGNIITAWQHCTLAPLTTGGHVVLAQFQAGGFDRDHACS